MGLLKSDDWSANWITASKWFTPPEFRPRGLVVSGGGWADIDLGIVTTIDSIKLFPYKPETFPLRFKILGSDEPQFDKPVTIIDESAQQTHVTGTASLDFSVSGGKARYIRLLIIEAPPKSKAVVRQIQIISDGKNVALMRPTREFGTSWDTGHAPFLVDGMPSQDEGSSCPPDACPTSAAPLFRQAFSVDRKVKYASLSIAALGMADVTINGKRVGDEVLGPPFTDATRRVVYVTRDVTSLLTPGKNAIGVTLGNGFFSTPGGGFGGRQGGKGPPRFLLQLDIDFDDGSHQRVASDRSWKWSRGEIALNDLWRGYTEDRRLAKPGWDQPAFDDSNWESVRITESLGGALRAPMGPPIRVSGELKPVRVEKNQAFFDVLSAGWPQLKVLGKAGQKITITGDNIPPLTFTLAVDGPTVLEPRFVLFAGPLRLKVDGLSAPLAIDDITIQLARADLKSAGEFKCSNPYLNQLYETLLRTHRNYDFDHPMDPTREKQGWTQDAQGMFKTAAYLTDVAGIYRKWWWDFADGQDQTGYVGSVLPVVGRQVYDWNSPWWSGVVVLLPWEHYQYYGDRRSLEEAYEPMRKYVDFLGAMAAAGVGGKWDDYPYFNVNQDLEAARDRMIIWNGAGDWNNPYTNSQHAVPTPILTMPAWFYYATIVSKTAAILGKEPDSAKYAAIADDVKTRFNARYFHPDTGLYGEKTDSQTAQVIPLGVGIVPSDKRALTVQRLVDAIHAHNDHVGTGFVALPFLLQQLTEQRESSLANKIVNQKNYPSWNTLAHDGVLGEGWHGGGAQMPSAGGAIGMWMYQSVLGIRPDPEGPGFNRFILAPQPDVATGLTWARGYFDSVHGRIASEWKVENGKFTLRATIPVGTTATIYIPTSDPDSVLEFGKKISEDSAIKILNEEHDAAVYQAGSGTYEFTSRI